MLDQAKKIWEMKKQADIFKKEMEAIKIDESLLIASNKNRIQMELLKSLNTAVKRSQQAMQTKMKNMPGFNLPGMG